MQHLDVELAHQLIRGKLPAADAAAWEQHLVLCDRCHELVSNERSWSSLLRLEQRAGEAERVSAERVLPRLESLIPGQARRQQRRRRLLLGACGGCLVLGAGAVAWRLLTPTPAQRLASELGITEAQQARIVSNLDALIVLRSDHWVADELSTVEMFEKLLRDERGPTP